jgi:hypothetical protein
MRIFKIREFAKEARRLGISDLALRKALAEIEAGKADALLGGEIVKQRLARSGMGKSGGARTILAFRHARRCIFIDVYAKSETENVSAKELQTLKRAAKQMLGLQDEVIENLLTSGIWIEVK